MGNRNAILDQKKIPFFVFVADSIYPLPITHYPLPKSKMYLINLLSAIVGNMEEGKVEQTTD